ncbi:MAG: DUF523 domain-containing protein [Kangiellaceae bacterium]|nr:DUF523 domain-containing protein [Kangiellaceae bacterium]
MTHTRPKILISACLLGEQVRYDGKDKLLNDDRIANWLQQSILVAICPEVSGGLSTPRAPAELQSRIEPQQVITINNADVTDAFKKGARQALELCISNDIKLAILTEGSPSCGSSNINDGQFRHRKIPGEGLTTKLLRENNITVFSHLEIDRAERYYQTLLN